MYFNRIVTTEVAADIFLNYTSADGVNTYVCENVIK